MPRSPRVQPGGVVFHVCNRGNEQRELFEDAGDYDAFLRVLAQAVERQPVSLFAYCLMPNHWHLLVRPNVDGALGSFMQWLTVTHVRRWREYRQTVGLGHLYQGPYKSFPVQDDRHFLTVCRYVERNALRARLTRRAERWRWSSLWRMTPAAKRPGATDDMPVVSDRPVDCPRNWIERVNRPESADELEALRQCLKRSRPFGHDAWTHATAQRLGLTQSLRPRGRPRGAQASN